MQTPQYDANVDFNEYQLMQTSNDDYSTNNQPIMEQTYSIDEMRQQLPDVNVYQYEVQQSNQLATLVQHIRQQVESIHQTLQYSSSPIPDQQWLQLIEHLNNSWHLVDQLQQQIINRLNNWKHQQKRTQIGEPFDDYERMLNEIQHEFETLAEYNCLLHKHICWLFDPQLTNHIAHQHIANIRLIINNLTRLQSVLISQSIIVYQQPDCILKTQQKFTVTVRMLIHNRLEIKQQLASVTLKIITEEDARELMHGTIDGKQIRTVGAISNGSIKLTVDSDGYLSAKFNEKLMKIDARRPAHGVNASTACDQKYALLFHVGPFELDHLNKFDVYTLSLPFMVTVHVTQDCNAQGAILWQRAFGSAIRSDEFETAEVPWTELAIVLKYKFKQFTGAVRDLSDNDLAYLYDRLLMDQQHQSTVTFHRFAKEMLNAEVNFSFWKWFYAIMQMIESKLLTFWDKHWLIGFISKLDASNQMLSQTSASFLLRFSDSLLGAVSIGFVANDSGNSRTCFHLNPHTIKDLDKLSLAERIATCPQLAKIRYIYPNYEKDEIFRFYDVNNDQQRQQPAPKRGYLKTEVVMAVKTSPNMGNEGATCSRASNVSTSMCNRLSLTFSSSTTHQLSLEVPSPAMSNRLSTAVSSPMLDRLSPVFESPISHQLSTAASSPILHRLSPTFSSQTSPETIDPTVDDLSTISPTLLIDESAPTNAELISFLMEMQSNDGAINWSNDQQQQ